MKSTPFDPKQDISPIPFSTPLCKQAKKLKENGLNWQPHVGCFVWDEQSYIEVPSPFPERIYFILNLGHFLKIFGSVESMVEKLVWLPTWHQARVLCLQLGIPEQALADIKTGTAEKELLALYELINKNL